MVSQRGFTLIEILIALAITGLLATGIAALIAQTFNINASSSSRMTALKQIEVAVDRIRVDVQMAQEIAGSAESDPEVFLYLTWKEWDNTSHEVAYSLDSATHEIIREAENSRVIAKNIRSAEAEELDSGNWSITLEAVVEDSGQAPETRTFEVHPRLSQ